MTRRISAYQKEAIKIFSSLCIFDDQQIYSVQLAKELKKIALEILDENLQHSKTICESLIEEHFKAVSKNIHDGTYLHSRGYEEYQEDYFEALELYEFCSEGQQAKQSVLQEYRKKTENERMQILNADHKLREEEKKIIMLQIQNQEEEAIKERALTDMEELRKRSRKAEQNYKDSLELYKNEMTQRANAEKEQLKKRMEHALKENERLLCQGYAEEARTAKSKLRQLEHQLRQKDSESSQRFRQFEQRLERELKERNTTHQKEMKRSAHDFAYKILIGRNNVSDLLKLQTRLLW